MSILQLLASDNYITVNKTMVKELGIEEAVIFGELCSEYVHWENKDMLVDGMFYCSSNKLEDITGLSEYKQRQALKNLIQAGYIYQELKGIPATRYFKIIEEQVLKLFGISSLNFLELDAKNFNSSKTTNKKKEKKENNSKELLEKNFDFGKPKTSKQSLYSKCVAEVNSRNYSKPLYDALINYLQLRLQMKDKPLYANSWKGLLNKLERDFKEEERIGVVFQSIERGYASFFPVSTGWRKNNDSQLDKPWEQGVSCQKATKAEQEADEKWLAEQRAKGVRVDF